MIYLLIYTNSQEEGEFSLKVEQIISTNYIRVSYQDTIKDVINSFISNYQDIGCVFDNSRLVGIITKYSLYRSILTNNDIHASIQAAIIHNPITLNVNDNIYRARQKLLRENVAHAIVINDETNVVGILTSANISQAHIDETKHLTKQLSNLMNNLQSIIISIDLEFDITTLNNAAINFIENAGYDPKEKKINYLFPEVMEPIVDSIQTNTLIDYKNITINDQEYISSFIPIRAWDKLTGIMIVLENVSKYEKIAKELEVTRRIEQTLDSALEAAYDGVVITDPDGVITKINQGFLDLTGYESGNNIVGSQMQQILPEIPIEKSIQQKKTIEAEYIQINGQKTVVTQNPIYRNNKNIGIIIKVLFRQLELWKDLFGHMDRLETEISYYRNKFLNVSEQEKYFNHIISTSPIIDHLKNNAYVAASSLSNILVTGESGTGKELFANGIHDASKRTGNFVKVNCAAIPAELLESELFGYEEGAFTGARKGGKIGKFELANGGTFFLDEIGELSSTLQVKLLRVLQDKTFERVGGTKTLYTDTRIITATNRDLLQMVSEGEFRADLYYRINVIQLHIPPLRDRQEDIPYLAHHFIDKFNETMNKDVQSISVDALTKLKEYVWPGNIRELENILERAFHFSDGNQIEANNIVLDTIYEQPPLKGKETNELKLNGENNLVNSKNIVNNTEKQLIIQALKTTNGNRSQAAKLLNISRSTLYYKLNKFEIKEVNEFN